MPWAGEIVLHADGPNDTIVFVPDGATSSNCRLMPRRTMSALSYDTGIISPFHDSIGAKPDAANWGLVRCLTGCASAASEEPKATSESAARAC